MGAEAIDETTLICRSSDAIVGDLPGETVLLHVGSASALRANATAAWLWEQLAEPMSIGQLAASLAERHGIPQAQAVADVRAFAEDLVSRGFLQRDPL